MRVRNRVRELDVVIELFFIPDYLSITKLNGDEFV